MATGGGHWGLILGDSNPGSIAMEGIRALDTILSPALFSRELNQWWVACSRSPGRAGAETQMLNFQLQFWCSSLSNSM